jgi:hypothetical protein
LYLFVSQTARDFEPIEDWQHHVENDYIEVAGFNERQTGRAVVRNRNPMVFLLKPSLENIRHLAVVLDN